MTKPKTESKHHREFEIPELSKADLAIERREIGVEMIDIGVDFMAISSRVEVVDYEYFSKIT